MTLHDNQVRVCHLFEQLSSATVTGNGEKHKHSDRLKNVSKLQPGAIFSCFHPEHLEEARHLYEVFWEAGDFDDFIEVAKEARTFVNEGLFAFACEVAVLHRDDCKGLHVPPVQEIFPDKFIPSIAINEAFKKAHIRPEFDESPILVDVHDTGNILDPEYRLAYYREDVGINAHHWHWHLVYPSTWDPKYFSKKKDRKGELFYYMHQQMCARYDCERLSNGMHRMLPFHNFDEPLAGYAPHLSHIASGKYYSPRPDGLSLRDLGDIAISDMVRMRERISDSIHLGYVIDSEGNHKNLDEHHGIDILGALVESSHESVNKEYYGNLHNWGHVTMARIHDPDGRFHEEPGVMSDTSTSLRDPLFYNWHGFIDDLFQEYKNTLKPYDHGMLNFTDIQIQNVTLHARVDNVIHTFMRENELELKYGVNLGHARSVKARYYHLDHEPFSYAVDVQNNSASDKHATVRIFLSPKYDELGNEIKANDLRHTAIELDKFKTDLHPGKNTVVRHSLDSSVTLSHQPTFEDLLHGIGLNDNKSEFCSCGWPSHPLVPKGNVKGMEFHLFVMLTDWDKDKVDGSESVACVDAVSYCGARDHKYPDMKPMGFLFDRPILTEHISDFLTNNMFIKDIHIKFHE
uniref:Hemocyanin subunit II n=1 Tax=Carcinoscorpius rotundicauda TaxID=6848 RepID=A1X1V2_CARRO|nr:hemocyanin subunit II [Carcinoscorpius rotundicauda]